MSIAGRSVLARWALAAALAAGLTGCESPAPPAEYEPPIRISRLNLAIQDVTIASPPVIEFRALSEAGTPLVLSQQNLADGELGLGLSKLVPGTAGDADSWQSYINRTEIPNPNVGPGGSAALPGGAMQAALETRGSAGTLTPIGAGLYRYTFSTDVADPAQTMGVAFDASLTHRAVVELALEQPGGGLRVGNAYLDFVPDGSPIQTTKLVAMTRSCNECHDRLVAHGGRRIEVGSCVNCHNPGTTDANSGNNLDFARMIHKIHSADDLSADYVVWGFEDRKEDFSSVGYPQDNRNCMKCHSAADAATPDGDNWKSRPTQETCGSCHDDLDFTTHQFGFAPGDNSVCGVCHGAVGTTLYFTSDNAHIIHERVAAGWFRYNILGVRSTGPGQMPVVTFEVLDPRDGSRYDILSDPEFAPANGARLAVLLGWDTEDYSNAGSGASTSPADTGQTTAFPEPGQPVSIDALATAWETATPNVFQVSSPVAVPRGTRGTGVAAIEGHPAAIVDPGQAPGVYQEVPVRNAFRYFGITDLAPEPRREVVALAKCNQCHDYLSLHGGNRQGAIEVCVICHNPDATDIIVRPATLDVAPQNDIFDDFTAVDADGKREQAIHFKHMVHALHAGEAGKFGFRQEGIAVRGFGRFTLHDYSETRYPGMLSNCATCHDGDSYELPTPNGSLATTVRTASPGLAGNQAAAEASLANPADDLNISPMASACGSCHDSSSARAHIQNTGGGAFDVPQAVVDGVLVEACGGCHGPGEVQDVSRVHDIHPVP